MNKALSTCEATTQGKGPTPGSKNQGCRAVAIRPVRWISDAARSRLRHFSPRPGRDLASAGQFRRERNVDNTTRKPMLLLRLSGLFLLRLAQRTFL